MLYSIVRMCLAEVRIRCLYNIPSIEHPKNMAMSEKGGLQSWMRPKILKPIVECARHD